jgi:hypothetical protein
MLRFPEPVLIDHHYRHKLTELEKKLSATFASNLPDMLLTIFIRYQVWLTDLRRNDPEIRALSAHAISDLCSLF